jgi:hypothetical protein
MVIHSEYKWVEFEEFIKATNSLDGEEADVEI